MSENQLTYTPGPWHIGFNDGSGCGEEGEEGGIYITSTIAYEGMDDFAEDHVVIYGSNDGWGIPQGVQKMADARLIMITPELYEAALEALADKPGWRRKMRAAVNRFKEGVE